MCGNEVKISEARNCHTGVSILSVLAMKKDLKQCIYIYEFSQVLGVCPRWCRDAARHIVIRGRMIPSCLVGFSFRGSARLLIGSFHNNTG